MPVSVTQRVHIAPQGYENERIHLPAKDLNADKVILLPHNDEDDLAESCRNDISDELERAGIEMTAKSCNIFDLNDAFGTMVETIWSQEDDDIKLNVSAGSKITAIAGMMACMFTGAEPIYVKPEGYGDATVSNGMESVSLLPTFPITEPDYQLIRVLDYIYGKQPDSGIEGVLLKEIGDYLLETNLPAVQGSDKEPGEGDEIYNITREKIVTPLLRQGLVTEQKLKGGVHIQTTSEGEEVLTVGKSLLALQDGRSS